MVRNNRNAPNQNDQIDNSLTVATLQDVLFKPIGSEGQTFLTLRTVQLEKLKRKLNVDLKYEVDTEEDIQYLKGLEPTEFKDQDHYAVLGLKHMRFRATDEDIKRAYRLRVLKHHPDKRMGAGEQVNPECDYFACIVKAFEVLTQKRQAYDSVDPFFDNYIPSKTLSSKDSFFTVYGKWFELNSRWSTKQHVPLLGNMSTPREKVDRFYSFWYDFDSWREYSYLDEEEKEKGQFREERRWIDKQNKAARAKLKKEEMARMRTAVDQAYALDPRIEIFKAQDNEQKLAKKLERQKATREKYEQEEKMRREAEEQARLEKEKAEAEQKEKDLKEKKEKDALKKAVKKEKKNFRTICKDNNYYGTDQKSTVDNMATMETLCEVLDLNEMTTLNTQLASLSLQEGMNIFIQKANEINTKIEEEKAATTASLASGNKNGTQNGTSGGKEDWGSEELALLVKAVNVFPAGTVQRWDVVANFMHQHYPGGKKRSAREVLAKAKDLKASDFSKNTLKEEANQQAYAVFEKNIKTQPKVEAEETKRDDEDAPVKLVVPPSKPTPSPPTVSVTESAGGGGGDKAWTADEQKLLEQALKTYPSSHPERWERIADCVPGRSKKECMARFKELAALVKAKKMAQSQKT